MWKHASTFVLGFVVSAVVLAAIPAPEPNTEPAKVNRVEVVNFPDPQAVAGTVSVVYWSSDIGHADPGPGCPVPRPAPYASSVRIGVELQPVAVDGLESLGLSHAHARG